MSRIVLRPSTDKLSLVTLCKYGNAGGGGRGVTKFATEAGLLAMPMDDGSIGYAEDTDRYWYRRGGAWSPHPNLASAPQFDTTTAINVTVDPVNGDDSDWNDGTVTPLKTIKAVLKRIPVRTVQAETSVLTDYNIPVSNYRVFLKGGTHVIGDVGEYGLTCQNLNGVYFYGEYEDMESFTLDHYSGDGMHLWKAPGTPWVADAHVAKIARYTTGGKNYYFPILKNGVNDLELAWPPNPPVGVVNLGLWEGGCVPTPNLGATITICQHKTHITGKPWIVCNSSNVLFEHIRFDRDPATIYGLTIQQSMVTFRSCFLNGVNGTSIYAAVNSVVVISNTCCYMCNATILLSSAIVLFFHTIAINNGWVCYPYESRMDCYGYTHFRSSGAFVGTTPYHNEIISWNGIWHCIPTVAYIYGLDNPGGFLYAFSSKIIDNYPPVSVFVLAAGVRALVKQTGWDETPGGKTMVMGSHTPGPWPTYITYADLVGRYGGHYDYGWGCEIIIAP